jgi:penicillin-binding protein 2
MQSCNPFFYQVGFVLNQADPWLLPNYTRRVGLGALTGLLDIPEEAGLVPDPDYIRQTYGWDWNYSNAVNLAIGQGEIQATPLQMLRLYAAIANNGDLVRPHLVRERGILDQRTFVAVPEVTSNFEVAPEVLELVRAGMCDVVSARSGTAWHIFNLPQPSPLLDIGVCGKTGTAQAPGDGALPHSWFAAFAPAINPEIAIVVMVENAGDGSAVAAPITERILEYYFFLREGAQP